MVGFVNLCAWIATAGGLANFVPSAAAPGRLTPAQAGAVDGTTYRYYAIDAASSQWELGSGTYAAATGQARTTIHASSSGAKIDFSVPPLVSLTHLAEDLLALVEATDAEIWAGSDITKPITSRRFYTASAPVALTDAETITVDLAAGINFTVTLAGNRTLASPTNAKAGQAGLIRIVQDDVGARTLAYGGNWKFQGGANTLSVAANAVDVLSYFVFSPSIIYASLALDWS